ncbi:MAG TPA: hypothetical protein VGM29_15105 [Polyangiaceae bacterium]|jgi:hypothetical protein
MKRADPIIEELHKVRDTIAKRYGFDVQRIAAAFKAKEGESGHPVVSRPPRRVPKKRAS